MAKIDHICWILIGNMINEIQRMASCPNILGPDPTRFLWSKTYAFPSFTRMSKPEIH